MFAYILSLVWYHNQLMSISFLFCLGLQKQGQIRVHSGGILWKKQGGGKAVEVDKSNISGLFWMKVQRTNQLGVRSKDGVYYKFTGFRDQVHFFSAFFLINLTIYRWSLLNFFP